MDVPRLDAARRVRLLALIQGIELPDELVPQLEAGYWPDTSHVTYDPLSDPLNDPFPEELR